MHVPAAARSNLVALVALVVVLAAATASCSTDERGSVASTAAPDPASLDSENRAVSTTADDVSPVIDAVTAPPANVEVEFQQPDPLLADPPAIRSVVTAQGVDARGRPQGISANFTTDAASLAAIVEVGPLATPTAELVVAWFHLDGTTPTAPIFEHHLEVRAGDHAYSTAVSSGVLALARYSAVATIAAETVIASWMVSEERATANRSSVGPSPPADDGTGRPPSSGESGSIPGGPPEGPAPDGCALSVAPAVRRGHRVGGGEWLCRSEDGDRRRPPVRSAARDRDRGGRLRSPGRPRPVCRRRVGPPRRRDGGRRTDNCRTACRDRRHDRAATRGGRPLAGGDGDGNASRENARLPR